MPQTQRFSGSGTDGKQASVKVAGARGTWPLGARLSQSHGETGLGDRCLPI